MSKKRDEAMRARGPWIPRLDELDRWRSELNVAIDSYFYLCVLPFFSILNQGRDEGVERLYSSFCLEKGYGHVL